MLLPMIGFLFFLIVVGGLLSLLAVADPHHERSVPLIAFPLFFAGLFSLPLSFGLEFLGDAMVREHELEGFGFLCGYVLGIVGGAILGYGLALKHKRSLIESIMEEDDGKNES